MLFATDVLYLYRSKLYKDYVYNNDRNSQHII